MTDICPACETGRLHAFTRQKRYSYGDASLLVEGLLASSCDVCGEELETVDQARQNERLWADARRRHDGLLVSSAIAAFRARWGLTQQQASQLLGGGANAFSKYERGEVCQSKSMDLLIKVSDRSAEARSILAEEAGIAFGVNDDWQTVACVVHEPIVAGVIRGEMMSRRMQGAMEEHPLWKTHVRIPQSGGSGGGWQVSEQVFAYAG